MAKSIKIAAKWIDDDGAWIMLRAGWQDRYNPQCHTIHEDTMREALSILRDVIPCHCKQCEPTQAAKR